MQTCEDLGALEESKSEGPTACLTFWNWTQQLASFASLGLNWCSYANPNLIGAAAKQFGNTNCYHMHLQHTAN